MQPLAREAPDYERARACYLAKLPASQPLFGFGDFSLLRLRVDSLRYVGGFGRAHSVSADSLRRWALERDL